LDDNKNASEKKSVEPQPEKSLTADEKSVIFEQDIIDDIDNLLQKSLSNSMNKFNLNSGENSVMSDRLSDISGNLLAGKKIISSGSQRKSVSEHNIESSVSGDQNVKNEEALKQKNHIRKVSEVILNQINREFDVNLDSMLSEYQEKKSKRSSSRLFSPNSVKSNMTKKSSANFLNHPNNIKTERIESSGSSGFEKNYASHKNSKSVQIHSADRFEFAPPPTVSFKKRPILDAIVAIQETGAKESPKRDSESPQRDAENYLPVGLEVVSEKPFEDTPRKYTETDQSPERVDDIKVAVSNVEVINNTNRTLD
jgi:hypothetical protein